MNDNKVPDKELIDDYLNMDDSQFEAEGFKDLNDLINKKNTLNLAYSSSDSVIKDGQ